MVHKMAQKFAVRRTLPMKSVLFIISKKSTMASSMACRCSDDANARVSGVSFSSGWSVAVNRRAPSVVTSASVSEDRLLSVPALFSNLDTNGRQSARTTVSQQDLDHATAL